MKNNITNFSRYLNKFFTHYLTEERHCSGNTVDTYRYTFILFLEFMSTNKGIKPESLEIKDLNRNSVSEFLEWIEKERHCCIHTRNNRLAAILSFIHFVSLEYPDYLDQYNEICTIAMKKDVQQVINYIEIDGIKLIMEQPDQSNEKGVRDFMILLIMYEAGVRVSELVNIKIEDFHMERPYYLKIVGKGKKERIIPLSKEVIIKVRNYIKVNKWERKPKNALMFPNHQNDSLSRQAVTDILKKYSDKAKRKDSNLIPNKVTPHVFRHSKAMHLLQNGVNLIYIRDFLGHSSVITTEIYAKANSKAKQEAIEKAFQQIYPEEEPEWTNPNTLEWLKNFNK